jgi:hypothetical protein
LWLEPTFRRNVSPPSSGQVNRDENTVSRWVQLVGSSHLHVSDEVSLSDHRYICFELGNISIDQVTYRNPRRTNWESYKYDLKGNLETLPRKMRTMKDIDGSVDQLQRAIISSYHRNCPAKTTRPPGTVPWWNKKLSGLRAKVRKQFNVAKRTGQWGPYKETLTCYNKEIRKAKQSSWRR